MLPNVCRPSRRGWFVFVLPCLFALGCGGSDESTRRAKEPKPDETKKPDEQKTPSDAKVRLLGALIPVGDGTNYFVKFVGPIEKIDANEKDFDAFLNSIRVPGEGGKPISWTVPAGWKEGPARQMRIITLQKGDGTPDLYLSDPFGGTPLMNVNRWIGEVGLKPVTEADLPGLSKEVTLGAAKAARVDFRGPGGKSNMGMGK